MHWIRNRVSVSLVVVGCALGSGCELFDPNDLIPPPVQRFDAARSPGLSHISACRETPDRVSLPFVLYDEWGDVMRPGALMEHTTLRESLLNTHMVRVSSAAVSPTTPKNLIVCARSCNSDIDCELGLSCFEGFCGRTDEDLSEDACTNAGLDLCVPFDPAIDTLFEFAPPPGMSLCRTACVADEDCPSGLCVRGGLVSHCALSSEGDYDKCESDSDCQGGFACIAEASEPHFKTCRREAVINMVPESGGFVGQPPTDGVEAPRAVALLLDNSGSLYGRGVQEDDRTVKLSRSTDPDLFRIAAAKTFLLSLKSRSYGEGPTTVGIWSFRGESELGVKPLTGRINVTPVNPFVGNFDVARGALDTLAQDSGFGRSNVFLGIKTVAQNMIDIGLVGKREATIIVFTDGPDDSVTFSPNGDAAERALGLQRWQQRLDEAIEIAKAARARVVIIHLDTGLDPEGLNGLHPDPLNARPFPRDKDGRFGPLPEYDRIACETQGQYIYAAHPFAIGHAFVTSADMLGGFWKVDLSLDDANPSATGIYRLRTELQVEIINRTAPVLLAPINQRSSIDIPEALDNRGVLFVR